MSTPEVLRGEFGAVAVNRDDSGLGPRLEVRCLRTGASVRLDPFVLATLAELGVDNVVDTLVPTKLRLEAERSNDRNTFVDIQIDDSNTTREE